MKRRMRRDDALSRKLLFVSLPVILIAGMSAVFFLASRALGRYGGYLVGFLFVLGILVSLRAPADLEEAAEGLLHG
ncbi:hypothetical protein [Spirochaeta thermophila]|uniref:hypothetical protein n=1 Tax=Winmispira thermophila TaxID=154 RepID=UPI0012DEF357|nr:hypothetical protein [Spirochaeta thermophila]